MTEIPDVKLENLLRLTCDPDSSVVLADFGAARILDSSDEMLKTVNYTPGYKAPEVIQKKGQGKAIDMWCLGVVTYTLLCGETPFEADNDADIDEKCISGWFTFGEHERHWGVSRDAKFFIMELLQLNPEDRPTSQVGRFFSCLSPLKVEPASNIVGELGGPQTQLAHRGDHGL